MRAIWGRFVVLWRQTARLMVGVPDYEAYCGHMRRCHPEREPLGYEAFFRERQEARYGGSRPGKCC
ncbi:MAG: YbdD/YjiX family protein [Magnetococcales bacterium]|nr:YbdD/YjiX family protein [Magnetococcales bacterium]